MKLACDEADYRYVKGSYKQSSEIYISWFVELPMLSDATFLLFFLLVVCYYILYCLCFVCVLYCLFVYSEWSWLIRDGRGFGGHGLENGEVCRGLWNPIT